MENSILIKYDLAFGNAIAVRQAFLRNYYSYGNDLLFDKTYLKEFDYPLYEGDPELVELTRQVIKRQTGIDYKHVILTNGATGGVVISLRSYAQQGFTSCWTRRPPWYMKYPMMIKAAGLDHCDEDNKYPSYSWKHVKLMDFPSNPLGLTTDMKRIRPYDLILDGVYHSMVYSRILTPLPQHDILVGSYSKLLGLNGIRVGWVALNDDLRYERLKTLVEAEYCGLSKASTDILINAVKYLNWESFERDARSMLDDNREEISKLKKYLGNEVPEIGMFYYGYTDAKVRALLEKAGVKYTSGVSLGTHEDFGRLNVGQDRHIVRNAVAEIIKADKIR